MKIYMLMLIMMNVVWGTVIVPKTVVKTSSPVLDFVISDGRIWAGTDTGEILHIHPNGKILSKSVLKPTTNAWGETIPQKIMSIDVSPNKNLIAVAGEDGNLYVKREGVVSKTGFSTKTVIKKIAFISNTRVIIAMLSNQVAIFDIPLDKTITTFSGGTSPLSDMSISKDRKTAAIAGEAGIISLIDTDSGTIKRRIRGGNVDNIYKIDIQNNHIITAGQDRRAIIYTMDGRSYVRYNGTFLIYAAALSPSAARAAITLDENNQITVIDTFTRKTIAVAKGHEGTLNRIAFMDESHFVSSADENKFLFWEIP